MRRRERSRSRGAAPAQKRDFEQKPARAERTSRPQRLASVLGNAQVQRMVRAAIDRDESGAPGIRRQGLLGGETLHLDPRIEAEMQAMRVTRSLLDPATIRAALESVAFELPPPDFLRAPPAPEPSAPSESEHQGEPRAATGGDVMRALTRLPAVQRALTSLRSRASSRVKRDFRSLSAGEAVAAVSTSAAIAGPALAMIASDPRTRNAILDRISGTVLPVPGVTGLSVEFDRRGGSLMVGLHLDVGALLPASFDFGPATNTPSMGRPLD